MVELPLDYVAGLFDGEGYFTIGKSRVPYGKREFQFLYAAGLNMTDEYVVSLLHQQFGGWMKMYEPNMTGYKNQWRWAIGGKRVQEFSDLMLERLIVKKKQCELMVEYTGRVVGVRWGHGNEMPDEEYDYRFNAHKRMMDLNGRVRQNVSTPC